MGDLARREDGGGGLAAPAREGRGDQARFDALKTHRQGADRGPAASRSPSSREWRLFAQLRHRLSTRELLLTRWTADLRKRRDVRGEDRG